jgi:glycosyltransferase involved in cell wall biosynthesis
VTAHRILICLHDFHRGGTERIALGLARAWREAGREVTILCGSTEGGLRDQVDASVMVEALDPAIPRGFLSRRRLGRAMAKRIAQLRPDLIFLPGNFHALLANRLRAATAASIVLKISNPPVPDGVPFAAAVFRRLTRGVTAFAAMNSGLQRQLQSMLPGKPVVTLHDPVYLHPAPPVARTGDHILWIGRLEQQKDPLLALDVIAAAKDLRLTILGEGSLRRDVERRIDQLYLRERVSLHGHVKAIEPFLVEADALLITSRYEGGPAVAVEALAADLPVVATDCSYLLHDLIATPEAGAIVPSRDPKALAAALKQTLARPRRPESLKALTAPFEPRACAQAYLAWFDSLTHG